MDQRPIRARDVLVSALAISLAALAAGFACVEDGTANPTSQPPAPAAAPRPRTVVYLEYTGLGRWDDEWADVARDPRTWPMVSPWIGDAEHQRPSPWLDSDPAANARKVRARLMAQPPAFRMIRTGEVGWDKKRNQPLSEQELVAAFRPVAALCPDVPGYCNIETADPRYWERMQSAWKNAGFRSDLIKSFSPAGRWPHPMSWGSDVPPAHDSAPPFMAMRECWMDNGWGDPGQTSQAKRARSIGHGLGTWDVVLADELAATASTLAAGVMPVLLARPDDYLMDGKNCPPEEYYKALHVQLRMVWAALPSLAGYPTRFDSPRVLYFDSHGRNRGASLAAQKRFLDFIEKIDEAYASRPQPAPPPTGHQ